MVMVMAIVTTVMTGPLLTLFAESRSTQPAFRQQLAEMSDREVYWRLDASCAGTPLRFAGSTAIVNPRLNVTERIATSIRPQPREPGEHPAVTAIAWAPYSHR